MSFREPMTMDEAEVRRLGLVEKLHRINAELSIRHGARDESGSFVRSEADYWDWRKRAVVAKTAAERELQWLKVWMKSRRRAMTADAARDLGFNPDDPRSLLLGMANLIQRLRSDGVDLEPDEIQLVNAVHDYLQHKGAAGGCQ